MAATYRPGVSVVLATVAASFLVVRFLVAPAASVPSGRDLSAAPLAVGGFRLTERSGRDVTEAELADRPWIAAFIFTRCPSSCPRISAVMKGLQDKLRATDVRLVSISVDPDHDTPEVLAAYAKNFGADPDRWHFLTGPKAEVHRLILEGFRLPVADSDADAIRAGAESVAHSARLALVGRGNRIIGFYDSSDPADVAALLGRAQRMGRAWVARLPGLNASLNGLSLVFLVAGWRQIRQGRVRRHQRFMLAAVVASLLFLASYLVYHGMIGGGVPFRGRGPIRTAYLTMLLSHVVLAAVIVPLIAMTLWRAYRRSFIQHAALARLTFPIWVYVSVTGVLVYVSLYQISWPS